MTDGSETMDFAGEKLWVGVDSGARCVMWGRKIVYTLEPGDKWAWFGDRILVVNMDKVPFIIDLATLKREEVAFL